MKKYNKEQANKLADLLHEADNRTDYVWEDGDIDLERSEYGLDELKLIIKVTEQFDKDNGIGL